MEAGDASRSDAERLKLVRRSTRGANQHRPLHRHKRGWSTACWFAIVECLGVLRWECFIVVATLDSSSVDFFQATSPPRHPNVVACTHRGVPIGRWTWFFQGRQAAGSLRVGVLMGKRTQILFPCECQAVLGK
jgi:hypothetical protein